MFLIKHILYTNINLNTSDRTNVRFTIGKMVCILPCSCDIVTAMFKNNEIQVNTPFPNSLPRIKFDLIGIDMLSNFFFPALFIPMFPSSRRSFACLVVIQFFVVLFMMTGTV
jgi:hypothetical protein